ncbi:hypothetical protein DOY81_008218, partial [Sarcophaga bullata]
SDQCTQTDVLQITENQENSHENTNGHVKYHTIERELKSPNADPQYKLQKSASFSSSSGNSLASNSLNSGTSSLSLRASPIRSSYRMLKSDKINTFQKWETTVESISYVTTKTVAISEAPKDDNRGEQTSINTNGSLEGNKEKLNGCPNGTADKDYDDDENNDDDDDDNVVDVLIQVGKVGW